MPEPVRVDLARYRVPPGQSPRLAERPTDDDGGLVREAAEAATAACHARLQVLQERLWAERRQALLVVLQGMDTSGKDSTIRRVFGPLNPLGVRVWNFTAPTAKELAHDFLWRVHKRVPGAGYIGIFNRSHYEDVLIVRVRGLAPPEVVERRYAHINAFEALLASEGTRLVKVMLHISKVYQAERLRQRLADPSRHWKFDPSDLTERARWADYQEAYERAIARCGTEVAPWYVVPAERRWFRDLVVAQLLVETLEAMDPRYPPPAFDPADYPPEVVV